MFGLPDNEEYDEEIDTGDEPLEGQDSQHTQLEIAHNQRLRREYRTAQRSAANAEHAHIQRLHREDQTVQLSAAEL